MSAASYVKMVFAAGITSQRLAPSTFRILSPEALSTERNLCYDRDGAQAQGITVRRSLYRAAGWDSRILPAHEAVWAGDRASAHPGCLYRTRSNSPRSTAAYQDSGFENSCEDDRIVSLASTGLVATYQPFRIITWCEAGTLGYCRGCECPGSARPRGITSTATIESRGGHETALVLLPAGHGRQATYAPDARSARHGRP